MPELATHQAPLAPENDRDPVVTILGFAIFFVIVTALTGALYFLMTGVIDPPAPRTALESQAMLVQRAVVSNPGSGQAWSDYIKTETTMGEYARAQQLVEQGRSSVKGDQRIHVDLAAFQLLLEQKRYTEADKLADNIIKQDRDNRKAAIRALLAKGVQTPPANMAADIGVQAHMAKAQSAAALKKWDVVTKQMTIALELSPQSSDLLAMRGDAYTRLGDRDKAKKDFKEALLFDPEYGPALSGLAKVGGK